MKLLARRFEILFLFISLSLTISLSLSLKEMENKEAIFKTDMGDFIVRFFPEDAPEHVKLFLKLAKTGFYDHTTFFRIIKYGIIQGGDPYTRDPGKRDLYGKGGLFKLKKSEMNSHSHLRGAVSTVLVPGHPESGGSQFFICVTDQKQLDGKYTVWGKVVSGMDVVEKISTVPVDKNFMALKRVEIKKIVIRDILKPTFTPEDIEEMKKFKVIFGTDFGEIVIDPLPDIAPANVCRFLNLASANFYTHTSFHRVVKDFVIQGGSMSSRIPKFPEVYRDWLKPLKAEFSKIHFKRGVVGMARGKDVDSATDSFFIALTDLPSLDGKYTVIGKVIGGFDTIGKIESVRVNGEIPEKRIEIKYVKLEKKEVKK